MILKPMAEVKRLKIKHSKIAQPAGGVKNTTCTYNAKKPTTRNMALEYSLKLPVLGFPCCLK